MQAVAIPADYFQRASQKEYSEWRSAWAREALQNAVDAGAKNVDFLWNKVGSEFYLSVRDDGRGCDRKTIEEKLLVLGASGKDGVAGAVGGFGHAKSLLFFSWPQWQIRTQNVEVSGESGAYEIVEREHASGFFARVTIPSNLNGMDAYIREYLIHCDVKNVRVTFNSEEMKAMYPRPRNACREFSWGKIYRDAHTHSSYVSIRVNGVEMFQDYSGHDKELGRFVIELTGSSTKLLTSNRDAFRSYKTRSELSEFITSLRVDGKRAVEAKEPEDTISFFDGMQVLPEVSDEYVAPGGPDTGHAPGANGGVEFPEGIRFQKRKVDGVGEARVSIQALAGPEQEIVLKDKVIGITRSDMPDVGWANLAVHTVGGVSGVRRYLGTKKAKHLLAAWTQACAEILATLDMKLDASGLTFKADREAECLKIETRFALLINPNTVAKRDTVADLLLVACHEISHLLTDSGHSEGFALAEMRVHRAMRKRWVYGAVERAYESGVVTTPEVEPTKAEIKATEAAIAAAEAIDCPF